MDAKTLSLLKAVSEQLAEWSNGCLDTRRISGHEQTQLERLEFRIEEAIITEDDKWLP